MIAHPPRPDQGSAPTPRWAAAPRSGGRWWVRDRENESRHPGFERRALHWYMKASSQHLGSARGLFFFSPPSRLPFRLGDEVCVLWRYKVSRVCGAGLRHSQGVF